MNPTLMELQKGQLVSFQTGLLLSYMNPSFPLLSGAEQLPQWSILITGCLISLSSSPLLTSLSLAPSQMSLSSGSLVQLAMFTFRRTRGRDSAHTCKSVSLLDIQGSLKGGSSTILRHSSLCFLTEQTLMKGSVLVSLVSTILKTSSLLLLMLLLLLLLLLPLMVLSSPLFYSQMCHIRWEMFKRMLHHIWMILILMHQVMKDLSIHLFCLLWLTQIVRFTLLHPLLLPPVLQQL